MSREILVFEVGGRRFGLPVSVVRELLRAVTIVALPFAPAVVEGVINVRGRLIPVLDIRRQLGLDSKPVDLSDHLVIVERAGRLAAVRVDRALELRVDERRDRPGHAGAGPHDGAPSRLAAFDDGLTPVLDVGAFLSDEQSEAIAALLPDSLVAEEFVR